VLKVFVESYYIVPVKPKISKTILQYVILTKDEREYSRVFFVDVDKYDKEKFIQMVKEEYSKKYGIREEFIEVNFLVDIVRITTT